MSVRPHYSALYRVPKYRHIKKIRNITRCIVAFVLGGYLLLLFGLNAEPVQRYTAKALSSLLQEKLQTEVRIEKVGFGLFNRLTLQGINIEDQSGEQMLEASMLSAKIEVLPLLSGEISLRTISLLDGKIHLYKKQKDSAPNFQFVVDAFKSKDQGQPSRLNLRVNSLVLRRCQVAWHKNYEPPTPSVFNPSHIHLRDIDANLSLKRLTPDSLNLRIRSFSVNEQSGMAISKLSMRLAANRRGLHVSRFELEMPHGTHLSKDEMSASFRFGKDGKQFWKTLVLTGSINAAQLATDDAVPVVPQLKGMHRIAHISTDFRIVPELIVMRRLSVKDNAGDLALAASAGLNRDNGRVTGINAVVRKLNIRNRLIASVFTSLTKKETPEALLAMGDLDFKGKLHYSTIGESRMEGVLRTAVGHIEPDVNWKGKEIKGRIGVRGCELARLFPGKNMPESVDFTIDGKADLTNKAAPAMEADLRISEVALPDYQLHGIKALGKWAGQRLSVRISATDPACSMEGTFQGLFDGHDLSKLSAKMNIRSFAPATLGLTKLFEGARFSSMAEMEMAAIDLNNPDCRLRLSDFDMQSASSSFHLQEFNFTARPSSQGTHFKLDSDFATVEADGPLSFLKIKNCGLEWINSCMPGVASSAQGSSGKDEEWRLMVRLRDARPFEALMGIPLKLDGTFSLDGNLRGDGGRSSVVAQCDGLKYNGTAIKDLRLYLQGEHGRLSLLAQVEKNMARSDVKFVFEALAGKGKLQTNVAWDDGRSHKYRGTLRASTEVDKIEGKSRVRTTMIPSSLSINDSIWNVAGGVFVWSDRGLSIDRFHLSHAAQSLRLDGRLSNKGNDSIMARLQKMDISFLLGLVNFDDVQFAGRADGTVSLSSSLQHPRIEAKLSIPDFLLNGAAMGHADIESRWNNTDKRIELRADMRDGSYAHTTVNGYVSPPQKQLDLHIGGRNTNVAFLRKYVSDIFGELNGRLSGHCRLYGPFKKLDFEGKEEGEVSARILATGVKYKLQGGSIDIVPGHFNFNGMHVSDEHGGHGTINGSLGHTHLKDINYSFRLGAENLLVYDRPKEVDMPFYATVYGTGSVNLSGKPGQFNADINLRPDKNTTFVYTIDTPDSFSDVQMLTFGHAGGNTDSIHEEIPTAAVPQKSTTDIRLNFTVDMNPDATLRIIMDEKAGDNITVHGRGPIRASYYNKGSFNMYGTYTVAQGIYKMSIQDIIRKDFELENGGRIIFSGDPYDGDLDLKAVYAVNSASLSDLNIGNSLSQSSVRVNCILNFKGKVNNPEVSFDLDLPTVNEDEKQMVRNLINTEEEMNMQILYLLGVGRFYTYNYNNAETVSAQSQSSAAMNSFLSNTLSSQLNDIISNAIGSSDWKFGANLSTGTSGWSDMDVEGLLSGRLLNNRLLINGKFGYRDRPIYNSTNFVGDFDMQYLLTPNGGVSLKAYSETNDRYFTKSSLTTQGIGVMLKRDFSNLKELFTPNRKKRKKDATGNIGTR